jgi:uncharacterized damage-inducible protein DinB
MAIADSILPEFDHEMATTRSLLERVPSDRGDWKPHEKSMTLGKLAVHLANLPTWTESTLLHDELDLNPPGGPTFVPPVYESVEKVLEAFDANVKAARDIIARTSDEEMMKIWTFKNGGHVVFSQPRAAVLRSFVMSHMIHHRGQLDVYLRLNDVPLPPVYGPTADSRN